MSALHPPPALRAVPDLDIQAVLPDTATPPGSRQPRRRSPDRSAPAPRRPRRPVFVRAQPAVLPAATLRPVLGKGGCLSAAGPPRLVALRRSLRRFHRSRSRGDRCRRSARAGHVVWTRHGVACPAEDTKIVKFYPTLMSLETAWRVPRCSLKLACPAEDTKIVSLAPGQKLGVRGVVRRHRAGWARSTVPAIPSSTGTR